MLGYSDTMGLRKEPVIPNSKAEHRPRNGLLFHAYNVTTAHPALSTIVTR